MNLDIQATIQTMLSAAKGPLGNCYGAAEPFAKSQFTNIAQTVAAIGEAVAANQMTREQGKYLLSIQEHATRSALLTVEGLGIIAVESALNAAIGAVTNTINTALGFALL